MYSCSRSVDAYRLGKRCTIFIYEVFQSLYNGNSCKEFPSLLLTKFCRIEETIGNERICIFTMVQALTAAIVALSFAIVAGIIKLIKRAALGSEFKEIEKVLDKFGSTKSIEYEIVNGEEKLIKKFSPKQLSEFISKKYQNKKLWENKDLELYQKVLENNSSTDSCIEEVMDIYHKGLFVKSPANWAFDKSENKSFPIITCYDGDDNSIEVFVNERYSSIEDCVEKTFGKSRHLVASSLVVYPKKKRLIVIHVARLDTHINTETLIGMDWS